MPTLPPWDDLRAGKGCPLDYPRPDVNEFMYFVRKLAVSSLYLSGEQAYRGTCLLVYDSKHAVRIDQLSPQEWSDFALDLRAAASALVRAVQPDHMNVESLGNALPHLHWHIIPRYKDDGRWGGPIWMTRLEDMPNKRLDEAEYRELARDINRAIDEAE